MSENARKKSSPESHLIERQLENAPVRTWAGHVRITSDEGTLTVPGSWHLELPHEVRRRESPRRAHPLPAVADLPAWGEHLLRLVTLRIPGMQLRIRDTHDGAWHSLEFAAPTAPPSVALIDRDGLRTVLGPKADLELAIVRD